MRTAVAETSIAAYHALGPKLGRQQAQIIAYLAKHCHRDWTRLELSEAMGMRLSSVCARTAELLEQQRIIEGAARIDRNTGRPAHPLSLAPVQAALDLEAA